MKQQEIIEILDQVGGRQRRSETHDVIFGLSAILDDVLKINCRVMDQI